MFLFQSLGLAEVAKNKDGTPAITSSQLNTTNCDPAEGPGIALVLALPSGGECALEQCPCAFRNLCDVFESHGHSDAKQTPGFGVSDRNQTISFAHQYAAGKAFNNAVQMLPYALVFLQALG